MKEQPLIKSEAPSADLAGLHIAGRQILKAHVSGYTRKDGTFVAEHDDKRVAAKLDAPAAAGGGVKPATAKLRHFGHEVGSKVQYVKPDGKSIGVAIITTDVNRNGGVGMKTVDGSHTFHISPDNIRSVVEPAPNKEPGDMSGKEKKRAANFAGLSEDAHRAMRYHHQDSMAKLPVGSEAWKAHKDAADAHGVARDRAQVADPSRDDLAKINESGKAAMEKSDAAHALANSATSQRSAAEKAFASRKKYAEKEGASSKSDGGSAANPESPAPTNADEVPDAENPKHALSGLDTQHLASALGGKADLNKHAKVELASRGMDAGGNWVGFKKAPAAHGLSDSDMAAAKNPDANPIAGHFQTLHPKVLSAVASGKHDLNAQASKEAAARGVDKSGKWVGFDKAKAIHASNG